MIPHDTGRRPSSTLPREFPLPIRTDRLTLVPGTRTLLTAELDGPQALSTVLGVRVPPTWPPPLYDRDAIEWMLARLTDDAQFMVWGFRYFVLGDGRDPVAIGAGGYKGPPDATGTVEIGYAVLPEHQRQGYATEATLGLVEHAFADPAVRRVIAETLPDLTPSIGVLVKCGFALVDEGSEPGVIRYERRR